MEWATCVTTRIRVTHGGRRAAVLVKATAANIGIGRSSSSRGRASTESPAAALGGDERGRASEVDGSGERRLATIKPGDYFGEVCVRGGWRGSRVSDAARKGRHR